MREQLPWHFDPDFDQLWEEALFVFDANVLLSLYEFSRETTEDFLKVLNAVEDRLWLPGEAADEFLRNRVRVIEREADYFDRAIELIGKWEEETASQSSLKGKIGSTGRVLKNELLELIEDDQFQSELEIANQRLQSAAGALRKRVSKVRQRRHIPDDPEDDYLLDQLTELFEDKTGKHDKGEERLELAEEAEERFEQEVPPGYEDYDDENKEGDTVFGDYLIWHETIRLGQPVIFVTGETKPDWWGEDGKIRAEMRREFLDETNGRDIWLYQSEDFLDKAKEMLDLDIEAESIEEANEVASANRSRYQNRAVHISGNRRDVLSASDIVRKARSPMTVVRALLDDSETQVLSLEDHEANILEALGDRWTRIQQRVRRFSLGRMLAENNGNQSREEDAEERRVEEKTKLYETRNQLTAVTETILGDRPKEQVAAFANMVETLSKEEALQERKRRRRAREFDYGPDVG